MANNASVLFREESFDTLSGLAASSLGGELRAAALISGGLFNTTYKITLADGSVYILRLGPVNREFLMPWEHNLMRAEEMAYALMRGAGIPCSEVVVCDCSKMLLDRDFMIVRYIDSQNLYGAPLTPEQKGSISRELGGYVAKMHGIALEPTKTSFVKFGRLSAVISGGGYDGWYAAVMAEIDNLSELCAADGFFTPMESARIHKAVERHKSLLDQVTAPRLTHADLWDANVLIKESDGRQSIAALIDPDRAMCGDVGFDLGNPWVVNDEFLAGYGLTRAENETPDKKIRHKIYSLIYFLIEAYVWHKQYNNENNAANGKKAVLERVEGLEAAAGYSYNAAYECLLTRRSIRKYKSIPVPRCDLEKIMEAGLAAPSAMNRQTATLICVTDRALIKTLSEANAKVITRMSGRDMSGRDGGDPFYGAPAVILVVADGSAKNWLQDGSLAMGNIMNAAHALGYGSCWINRCYEMFDGDEELRKKIGIPDKYNGVGCAVIGIADEARDRSPTRQDRAVYIE